MRSLTLARRERKINHALSSVEVLLTQADVSPEDRKKLSGILAWMMRSPHPFTKCHKALLAHGWSDDRAKKTCAVLKDVATGTTKWRNAQSRLSEYAVDLAEIANALHDKTEPEAFALFSECECGDTNLSDLESELVESESRENLVVLSMVDDDEMVAISKRGVAKITSPEEGMICLSANGNRVEVEVPDEGRIREVYDELRPSLDLADDESLMVEFVSDFRDVELAEADKDGLVWKTILRTGRWKVGPWSSEGKDVPMKVVAAGASDPKNCIISLEEVKNSFESEAKSHVTVPLTKENDALTHRNRSFDNAGFVRKLKIAKRDSGNADLVAGIEFTDPNVRQKALDGSLADVSGGIKYHYRRKRDGKVFPSILDHVAITNDPWIDGMTPFGQVAMSEEEGDNDLKIVVAHLAKDSSKPYGNVVYADPGYQSDGKRRFPLDSEQHCRAANLHINQKGNSSKYTADQLVTIKARIKSALKKYGVEVSASEATTEGGDDVAEQETATMTMEDLAKELGLSSVEELKDRLDLANESAEKLRARDIRDMARDWEDDGVPPAVIAAARPFLDGDDGGPALNLSEDGSDVQLSVTEIVKRVVDSVPRVDLADHAPKPKGGSTRPEDDAHKELSPDEKAERVNAFLSGDELDLEVHEDGDGGG